MSREIYESLNHHDMCHKQKANSTTGGEWEADMTGPSNPFLRSEQVSNLDGFKRVMLFRPSFQIIRLSSIIH